MQSARIWFQKPATAITLTQCKEYLQGMGVEVIDTEWRLEGYVVPQLHVTNPSNFLMQLEDDSWVVEEAEEISRSAPEALRGRLSNCEARLSFGDASDESVTTTDRGIFVMAGWTSFDPEEPQARELLEALTRMVDGIFEDNTTGTWWVPTVR
ncbi:hypothetical protein D2T29_21910 [Sinirhodobacter populi]|uniref:Uncharacterized protein n=1 Tax=Paenirhodobacter populi TaxID=2306993 RepID=A0A443JYA7_9RHOB|nr:hypothetical protein [Sinirhodobacter populi]RWR25512.1 hypothetical protein D2T29_21910 [Sinirhodobacter populi]